MQIRNGARITVQLEAVHDVEDRHGRNPITTFRVCGTESKVQLGLGTVRTAEKYADAVLDD